MVADDAVGQQHAALSVVVAGDFPAPGGMVQLRFAAFQARLEALGVLAQIVQQAGRARHFAAAEPVCSATSAFTHADQMVGQRLPVRLVHFVCGMRIKLHYRPLFSYAMRID